MAKLFRQFNSANWRGLAILASAAMHACMSIWFHYDRAWQGDEWGSYLAMNETYTNLFTRFSPAGWAMNFYFAGLKLIHNLVGASNWLLVTPGILAGCWLVCLTGAIARRLGSSDGVAVGAAVLAASNAFLVGYSVTIRPYVFLSAFSMATLLSLLSWRQHGRWRDGALCGAMALLALLASINAAYTLIAFGLLALCWTVGQRDPHRWRALVRLAIPATICVGLAIAAYWPQIADLRHIRETFSDTPPIPLTFLASMFTLFFGSGWLAVPFVAALITAVFRTIRDRRESQWLLLAIIAMLASVCLTGVSIWPQAYARYLIPILPMSLVVIGDGISCSRSGRARMLSLVWLTLLVVCNLATVRDARAIGHALPWHRLAAYLQQAGPADEYALLGPQIYNTALQVYGIRVKQSTVAALSSAPPDEPLRLVVVNAVDEFPLPLTEAQFGQLRVARLQGLPRDVGQRLITLLSDAANGRVSANLIPVYAQLRALSAWMGRRDDAAAYERLRQRCLLLRDRVRSTPPQFLRGDRADPIWWPTKGQGDPGTLGVGQDTKE